MRNYMKALIFQDEINFRPIPLFLHEESNLLKALIRKTLQDAY